jgi:hypothetical protein
MLEVLGDFRCKTATRSLVLEMKIDWFDYLSGT